MRFQFILAPLSNAAPRLYAPIEIGAEKHASLDVRSGYGGAKKALVGSKTRLEGPAWGTAQVNVVLGIRSGCHFCEASLPLYRKLAEAGRASGSKAAIYAVSSDSEETLSSFLGKGNVKLRATYQRDLRSIGIMGTPTVYLIDSQGVVRNVVKGELSGAVGERLMSAVLTGNINAHLAD